MKVYTIIKDGVVIGRFSKEEDRDIAFQRYTLPTSDNCMKSEGV